MGQGVIDARPPYAPKDPNCYAASLGTGTGLAFEASAMANAWVPGVELNISGALGGERTRYTAITFGLQFGWFGR